MKYLLNLYSFSVFPILFITKILHWEFSSSIIDNSLYLSSFPVLKKELEHLKNKGITLNINLAYELYRSKSRNAYLKDSGIREVIFEVFDWQPVKKEYLEAIKKLISEELKKGGKVNINCALGHSRSYSTILYYLIKEKWFSYEKAEEYVKARRKGVNLNKKQLKSFLSVIWESNKKDVS